MKDVILWLVVIGMSGVVVGILEVVTLGGVIVWKEIRKQ